MSAFSDYFTSIKESRNLTAAQIADICEKDVSLIFRWLNGTRIPTDWKQIEAVTDKLQMSKDEMAKLKNTYERTLLGEDAYACHQKIIDFFSVLQQRRDEYLSFQDENSFVIKDISLPEFVKMNNKMEILSRVQNALDYLTAHEDKKLYLKIQTMQPEVLMLLKMFCSQTKERQIEAIVYLADGEKDSGVHNLEVLKGIAEILVQRNSIEIFGQIELNYEEGLSDNWIMSEDFVLQFDAELSGGMMSTNQEWIRFLRNAYEELKRVGTSFGKKACESGAFISTYGSENIWGSSIEYMPCIGSALTREILERQIYSYIPERESLIQSILTTYANLAEARNADWKSFFFRDGLLEFMDTGRIENFPYMVYERPNPVTRCEILQNMIKVSKEKKLVYYMVKDEALPHMRNLYVEQMDGDLGSLNINMHFEEGIKERFVMEDKGLTKLFENFFAYLAKGGYAYSAKETVAYMEKVLEEYKAKAGYAEL